MTREQQEEVRSLRAGGAGYKKIATLLGLSVNTVKTFCRRNDKAQLSEEGTVAEGNLCPRCHKEIVQPPGRRRKVFCCDACRVAYWRLRAVPKIEKLCAGCGRPMQGNDPGRKYCGHACYISHRFGKNHTGGHDGRSA